MRRARKRLFPGLSPFPSSSRSSCVQFLVHVCKKPIGCLQLDGAFNPVTGLKVTGSTCSFM